MKDSTVILITGGSRSGKSRWAREKMVPYPRKVFLATAVATDEEMEERIRRHRKERGADFVTVEEPLFLARAIRENAPSADAILVDCLTFWLNNLFHHFDRQRTAAQIRDFLGVLEEKPTSLVLVTNEINMGVIPQDALSREFVDQQGRLNQEIARLADEVILTVAGIPLVIARKSNGILVPPYPLDSAA